MKIICGLKFVSTVQPAPVEQSVGSLRPTNALGRKNISSTRLRSCKARMASTMASPAVPEMSLMVLVGIQAIRKPSSMGHPFDPTAITKLLHSTCITVLVSECSVVNTNLLWCDPPQLHRPAPQRRRNQHHQTDANGHRPRRYAVIHQQARRICAYRQREHGKPQVSGENSAAESILGIELQQRGRENPDCRASAMT